MSMIPSRPWTVVVPIKSTGRAKSRLLVDPVLRRALARAMALDTVSAITSAEPVGRTLVVVEDAQDGAELAALPGVRIVVTRTRELNAAVMDGVARVDPAAPVAVVPADLPSLTATELTTALTAALSMAAAHPCSVVPDRAGTGTTLLTAQPAGLLRPRFGDGSFRLHVAAGAAPLTVPARCGLRRDVDLVADLPSVTGPATTSVLADAGRPTVRMTG